MALAVGDRLGAYEIRTLLGAGGMGEVYRAHDPKLGRDVAIKVLPDAVAADPARLARFDQEARALAAVNHPHVAALYGMDEAGATRFLVMELVEGETLARRLARGSLPVAEALAIAEQIAQALEAAHEKGIVHRDLKPANINIAPNSAIKVLDFGLAKAIGTPEINLATSTAATIAPLTVAGAVLGTSAYMSPEQAAGRRTDNRSDIWAFGCVLYELLTGKPAFNGDNISTTVAAVLRDEPDWSALPRTVPPPVCALMSGCLTKDPAQRISDISTVRFLLSHLDTLAEPPRASFRSFRVALAFGAALVTITGVALVLRSVLAPASTPLRQIGLPVPNDLMLVAGRGFALSPDGSRLVLVGRDADGARRLWVKSLATGESIPLAGTEGGFYPFWSPDGRDIGFFSSQKLKRIRASGGGPQLLAEGAIEPKGATWSTDGRIVFVPSFRTGLFEISSAGGEVRSLTSLDANRGELSHRFPQFLPDGRSLLFLVQTAEPGAADDRSRLEVRDANGTRHAVLAVNASAQFVPPNRLLFWRGGSLYAQGFDSGALTLRGEPRPIARNIGINSSEWAAFSASMEGTLAHHHILPFRWRLEWRERSGRVRAVAAPDAEYAEAALSPDGRRLAYVANNTTLWLLDLVRGTNTRLTFEAVDHMSPAWSPDGEWLAYASNKEKEAGSVIRRRRPAESSPGEELYSSDYVVRGVTWSPDGRAIAFEEEGDIFILDLVTRQARPRVTGPGIDRRPRFSPGGKWLAYSSDESGREEVYVIPAMDGVGKRPVSNAGGSLAEWSPRGDEIFFVGRNDELKVVRVTLGAKADFELPEALFSFPSPRGGYQVASDGAFLTISSADRASQDFTLVLNWPELLK